jgi:hypothetical protein
VDIFAAIKRENSRLFDLIEDVRDSGDPALHKLLFHRIATGLLIHSQAKSAAFYAQIPGLTPSDIGPGTGYMPYQIILRHLEAVHAAHTEDDWLRAFEALRLDVLRHFDFEERGMFEIARLRMTHAESVAMTVDLNARLAAMSQAQWTPAQTPQNKESVPVSSGSAA